MRSAVVILLAAVATSARAQVVRGTVVADVSGLPVGQAVVQLMDSSGATRLGTFSDDSGRFAIRAPAAGRYVLRAERIGFTPSADVSLTIGDGETVLHTIPMRPVPRTLGAVLTLGMGRCVRRDDAGAVADAWIAARASLQATRVAQAQRLLVFEIERLDKLQWANGKPISETRASQAGVSDNPFSTLPADTLARYGYRREQAGDTLQYFAPDAQVLLSDVFARDHCFRLRGADSKHPGMIGLSFEPVRLGDLIDVKGVLWMDQRTSELRTLEYQYASRRVDVPDSRFGGRVEFERLENGAVIVRRWSMRLPMYLGLDIALARFPRSMRRPNVAGVGESSGEVKSIATRAHPRDN